MIGVPTATRHSVWITDVAAVTALGNDISEVWGNLLAGRSAIRPITRFATDRYTTRLGACIPDLASDSDSSLVTALLERLLQGLGPVPPDAALVTATTKAGIDCLERIMRCLPANQGDVLPTFLAEYLLARLGLTGWAVNISAACASGTIALARGAMLISSGRSDAVLICAADLVSEFVFSGFSSLKALSATPCTPFDRNRSGLSLGEGAAALLLMHPERARRENRPCLGKLVGWGLGGDAAHITSPARDAAGLVQAVRGAFFTAGLTAERVCAVSAHGTGTVYNDLMELTALNRLFGKRPLPVHAVKGAIGHTLGAAGAIEGALGVMALTAGMAPPTIGFCEPEQGAAGRVSSHPTDLDGDVLLTINSGFGGINAALLIQKGEHR